MRKVKSFLKDALLKTKQFVGECKLNNFMLFLIIMTTAIISIITNSYQMMIILLGAVIALIIVLKYNNKKVDKNEIWYVKDIGLFWQFLRCYFKMQKERWMSVNFFTYIKQVTKKVEIKTVITILLLIVISVLSKNVYVYCLSLVIMGLTLYLNKYVAKRKEEDEIWRMSELSLITTFLSAVVHVIHKKLTSISFWKQLSIKNIFYAVGNKLKNTFIYIREMNQLVLIRKVSICILAFGLFVSQIGISLADINNAVDPVSVNEENTNVDGVEVNTENKISEVKQIQSFKGFNEDGFTAYQEIEKDKGTLESDLGMPTTLDVVLSDGSEEQINVTWQCIDDSFGNRSYDYENTNAIYTYEAILPEGYELVSDTILPWLNVTLKETAIDTQPNNEITSSTPKIETIATSAMVSDFYELKAAVADTNVTEITVSESFLLSETIELNRKINIKGIDDTIILTRATSNILFYVNGGDVSFSSLTIDGNKNSYTNSKPILTVNNTGKLTLNDKTIVQNNKGENDRKLMLDDMLDYNIVFSHTYGTAVLVYNGTAIMNDTATIRNNVKDNVDDYGKSKGDGGAGFLIYKNGELIINNGEISGNEVSDSGGGIYTFGKVTMHNGIIKNNTVTNSIYGGAGIRLGAYKATTGLVNGTFTMTGGTFSNNKVLATGGVGGAIYNTTACVTSISGGLIDSSNIASQGGAIFHSAASNNQSSSIPLAKLFISGSAIINSPVYLYEDVYLSISSKIEKPIIIQPMTYTEGTTLIKGESYTLTEADARKIKIKADGTTSWYAKLDSGTNSIILTRTNTLLKDTIYVDGVNGSDDTGDGTKDKPLKTIEGGLEYVAPGGTIIIDDTVTINGKIVIEAPESVYGKDGITIKSSDTCKEGTDACTNGVIVVGSDGELILGPIKVEVPITVVAGGKMTTSEQTKIHTTIENQPQDIDVEKGSTGNNLIVSVKTVDHYDFSYQWYSNTTNTNSGGSKVSGATSSTFDAPSTNEGITYYYCVITAENSSIADKYTLTSESVKVSVASKPQVSKTDETILGWNNGTITDVDDTMEYKLSTATSYTSVPSGTSKIKNLSPGTYYVRYQGNTKDKFRTEVIINSGTVFSFDVTVGTIGAFETTYGNTNSTKNIVINNNSNEYVTVKKVEVTGDAFGITNTGSTDVKIEKGKNNSQYQLALKAGLTKGEYSTTVTVTVVGNGTEHTISQTVNAIVNAKEITIGAKAEKTVTKVYDGMDKATLTTDDFTMSGALEGDDVKLDLTNMSSSYNSIDVSTANKVTASGITLTGKDAGKYTLKSDTVTFTGTITPMEIDLIWKSKTFYEWTGKAQYITPITFIDEFGTEQDMPYKIMKDGKKADFNDGGVYQFSFAEDEWEKDYGEMFTNYTISKESVLSKEYTMEYYELTKEMVSGIEDTYNHTGQTIHPVPTVIMNGTTLVSNSEYKVTYNASVYTPAGDYTVTISGKGKYVGTLVFNYKVVYTEFTGDPLANVDRGEGGYFSKAIRLNPATLENGYYGSLTPNGSTYTLSDVGTDIKVKLYFTKVNSQPIYWKEVIYSMDTAYPEITGIEDGKTYYVNQKAVIKDTNPYQFILNEKTVGDTEAVKVKGKEYTIEVGNQTETLKLRAVDKADNSTNYYNIKLQPLSTILDNKLNLKNVKSTDKSAIDAANKIYDAIDLTYATQAQKDELVKLKKQASDLLAKIEEVKKELTSIDKDNAIAIDKVTSLDKKDLNEIKSKIDDMMNGNNLVDEEKQQLQEIKKDVENKLTRVDEVQKGLDKLKEMKDKNKENIEKSDQSLLDSIDKVISDLENTYKDNITEKEKENVKETKELLNEIQGTLNEIITLEKEFNDIAIKDKYTKEEEEKINSLIDRMDQLSDHQKQIFDKDVKDKTTTIRDVVRTKNVQDSDSGIKIEGINNVDFILDTILSINLVTNEVNTNTITLSTNQEVKAVYDVKLLLNGKVIQPNGRIRISIPLSETQKRSNNLKVYYIDENGSTLEIASERIGDMLVFEVDHLSYYAIVGDIVKPQINGINSGDTTNVNAYLCLLLSSAFVLLRKKIKLVK